MTNIIITINRECGSGGGEIARRLGEKLGIKVYNRVMFDDIARQFDMSVENIERVNAGLRELCEQYDYLYFVDCNEVFCDENGYLYDHVSADGEHLLPKYSEQWAEEIRKRAITDEG